MSILRMTKEQVAAHNAKVKPKADSSLRGGSSQPGDSASRPEYEAQLERQLRDKGVIGIEREYFWARGRKYRGDVVIPESRLVIEINGGAHRIKARFKADIEKAQVALLQGWVLLPVLTEQVRDGTACTLVRQVLAMLIAERRW